MPLTINPSTIEATVTLSLSADAADTIATANADALGLIMANIGPACVSAVQTAASSISVNLSEIDGADVSFDVSVDYSGVVEGSTP